MSPFDYTILEETAKSLYIRALTDLPPDVRSALINAAKTEKSETGRKIIETMIKNIEVADQKKVLICQDTGLPIYFVKIGTGFHWNGAKVGRFLSEGTRRATLEFPFRGSSTHPISRINPQTSVGFRLPIIAFDFAEDTDDLEIVMLPKGSGSENMSALKMFIPADGIKAIKKFVVDTFVDAGGKPCPPGVIGVGLGGTADLVCRLAKEALVRPVGQRNIDPHFAELEKELEEAINATGIGPMGLGGNVSTLAVHVETAYTHITQNPVAINFQCWPARRAKAVVSPAGDVHFGF